MAKNGNGGLPQQATLGATSRRLRANGYEPVSTLWPHGVAAAARSGPAVTVSVPAALMSEHGAAVACHTGHRNPLALLVVTAIADEKLSGRVDAVLADRGLLHAPHRVGSDNSHVYPLRIDRPPTGSALDGAISLLSALGDAPADVLPLDGTWPDGSPLTIAYDALPALSAADATALLRELDALPWKLAQESRPPPAPSRAAWIGRSR